MVFQITYQISNRVDASEDPGFIYLDVHVRTDLKGHALIGTIGGQRVLEPRLRAVLDGVAEEIRQAVKKGARVE